MTDTGETTFLCINCGHEIQWLRRSNWTGKMCPKCHETPMFEKDWWEENTEEWRQARIRAFGFAKTSVLRKMVVYECPLCETTTETKEELTNCPACGYFCSFLG